MQLVICGSVAWKQKFSFFGAPAERWFLVLRAFWGTISLSSWFVSVKYTKFGDAAAIYYSYPVFIGVLARIFLKEPFTCFHFSTVLVTIAGILFISGPHYLTALFTGQNDDSFSRQDMIGIILATVGCFAQSCGNLSIRKLQKTPSSVVVVWFSIISMISSFILVPLIDQYRLPNDNIEWLRLLAVGLFGVLTQVCITAALKLEKATPVAILEAFNMIVAFTFQIVIFHEPISIWSGVGSILIGIAVVAIAVKKYSETKKDSCEVQVVVTEILDADLPPEYSPPPYDDKGSQFIFTAPVVIDEQERNKARIA